MSDCTRCGRCCTSFGVCVTPFDIARISKATGLKPVEFIFSLPEPPERERREPAVLVDGKPALLVLKWKTPKFWIFNATVCFFYTPEGCAIYGSRPMLCRTYPFLLRSGRLENVCSRACKKQWQPKDEQGYRSDLRLYETEVEKYREMAEQWNGKGGGRLAEFLEFALKSVTSAAGRKSGRSTGI